MPQRETNNLGDRISNVVDGLLSSGSFEQLNNSIRETIDAVFDELDIETGTEGRTSYGAGDWATGARNEKYRYGTSSAKWAKGGAAANRPSYEKKTWQSAAQGRKDAPAKEALYAKNPPGLISGPLCTFFGAAGTVLFGALDLAAIAMLVGSIEPAGFAVVFLLTGLLVPSVLLLRKGLKDRGQVQRFRTYVRTLGGRTFCSIRELAAAVQKPESFVADDLRHMIDRGFFPKGRLDMQETTLMLDDESYQQYLNANQAYEARRAEEEKNAKQAAKKQQSENIFTTGHESDDLRKAISDGENYIRKIREANDDIPGEEITRKLDRLEMLMKKIFTVLSQKPDQLPKLRKFMNYYMPTTDKLVQTYRELDHQPVEGENIQKAKREIEETLDTINDAYEKLLDNFFEEAAMDVTTDISVMQNLMAQEGLTQQPFGEIK